MKFNELKCNDIKCTKIPVCICDGCGQLFCDDHTIGVDYGPEGDEEILTFCGPCYRRRNREIEICELVDKFNIKDYEAKEIIEEVARKLR